MGEALTIEGVAPPRNVRRVRPRVCGTCAYFWFPDDGAGECTRPSGPGFDAGDYLWWETTCDLWTDKAERARAAQAEAIAENIKRRHY